MFLLLLRSLEFFFYHYLLMLVVGGPRQSPSAQYHNAGSRAALSREHRQAQLEAYEYHLRHVAPTKGKRRSLRMRAAQVFAYLLTRDNEPFRRYFLTAPIATIHRWLAKFRNRKYESMSAGGRPPISDEVVTIVLTLRIENPALGAETHQAGTLADGDPTFRGVYPQDPNREWILTASASQAKARQGDL